MKSNKLEENLINVLKEERYYYGEINYIRNYTRVLLDTIKATLDNINNAIELADENEYSDLQINTLKAALDNLTNASKYIQGSDEALNKNFPSRIGTLTPEQKEYIDAHREELEKETEAKEDIDIDKEIINKFIKLNIVDKLPEYLYNLMSQEETQTLLLNLLEQYDLNDMFNFIPNNKYKMQNEIRAILEYLNINETKDIIDILLNAIKSDEKKFKFLNSVDEINKLNDKKEEAKEELTDEEFVKKLCTKVFNGDEYNTFVEKNGKIYLINAFDVAFDLNDKEAVEEYVDSDTDAITIYDDWYDALAYSDIPDMDEEDFRQLGFSDEEIERIKDFM